MRPLPTFLPALTTTKPERVEGFLADLERSNVRQIALFPTTMRPDVRQKLYSSLERISGLRVPHVHLRTDSNDDEIDYLSRSFGTEVFNVHPAKSATAYLPVGTSSAGRRYLKRIYLENSDVLPEPEELAQFAGLCIDFSHWEGGKLKADPRYDDFARTATGWSVGCCHISAIREKDFHWFERVEDLSYLARYREFLPARWASLELENTLAEQLAALDYLATLLKSPTA